MILEVEVTMNKLQQLEELEGVDLMEMLEQGTFDSVCPGICVNKDCDYTVQVEPDCSNGYCEVCKTNTVKSACVLAGII